MHDKITFVLEEKELKKYLEWREKHIKTCPLYMNDGAIGGRESFKFIPTGLGVIIKIECGCGGGIDVTDYESW